jgi:hypothetical protein
MGSSSSQPATEENKPLLPILRRRHAYLEASEPIDQMMIWPCLESRLLGYKFYFAIAGQEKKYLSVYYHLETKMFVIDRPGDSALLPFMDRRNPFRAGRKPVYYISLEEVVFDQKELTYAQASDILRSKLYIQ